MAATADDPIRTILDQVEADIEMVRAIVASSDMRRKRKPVLLVIEGGKTDTNNGRSS